MVIITRIGYDSDHDNKGDYSKEFENNVCDKTAMVTITTKTIMKMTIKTMTDNK